jgi:Flp pilus assembly protein TadD
MYVQEGQIEEAIACLRLVLEQAPDNQETLVLLGVSHLVYNC